MFTDAAMVEQSQVLITIITLYMSPSQHDQRVINDRLSKVGAWVTAFRHILEQCGRPLFLRSIYLFWQSGTRALSLLESQQFPDLPVTTPTHLAHAPANLSLSALTWDNWEPYRKLLKCAWSALCEFTDFLYQEFEPQTHPEAFQALEDTLLLVESAGAICKIGVLGVDTWEVPSSSTGGTQ